LICYNIIKSGTRRKIEMAFKITDDCISCGACEAECPVGAIAEGDGKYEIDADACVSCGACADACPVAAPVEE
jgi:ferredoxin